MLRAGLVGMIWLVAALAPPAAFDPWQESARYSLAYSADTSGLPPGAVRLWLPVPAEGASQRVTSLAVEAPWPHRITSTDLGNRFAYVEIPAAATRGSIVLRATVERDPYAGLPAAEVREGSVDDPQHFRGSARKIPLDGVIRRLAEQESAGRETPAAKIRGFYEYVVRTMQYSKQGEGWGEGDAVWACASKYGNCTDFHSVFIGMARSQGIPARFVMGFPIVPDEPAGQVSGYHCWTEAWDPERGWLPLDASEARKSGRTEDYFGRLPSDRVAFTMGRDLVLAPPQAGEPLNYMIYPYAEVDGELVDPVPWTLTYRRLDAAP